MDVNTLKKIVLGKGRDPQDPKIFHKISLMAFFAWVGLGSDGLSSSCYGPPEVMLSLAQYPHLGLFIGLATVITIIVISSSYSQIIELFPTGGGGYLVASKLLSPYVGVVSGCALLIDYVLTITVSIASGADALFSFIPQEYHSYRLSFAIAVVVILTILNMRGVKESVVSLVPIFLVFVATHLFIIAYSIISHILNLPVVISETSFEFQNTYTQLGLFGTFLILMHAYSMGAGTFTGIEAVCNGIPILKEPRVKTAKTTMIYMAVSLSLTVSGLMLAYVLFDVSHQSGKTLNAVLFETVTRTWDSDISFIFVIITLISEAALLFVAAQTGFLDGPRVLANMALDKWVPVSFASLSDRLVTQKGIMMMGAASVVLMFASQGSVAVLVILYSINVFIDFVLSQTGMVKHWITSREQEPKWKRKIIINGIGLFACSLILVSVIFVKFNEGGWVTLLITGTLVTSVILIKKHYKKTGKLIKQLDSLIFDTEFSNLDDITVTHPIVNYNPSARTAVLLVNGFSGLGIHSLMSIFRIFGDSFKNFVFIQVGILDAGSFRGFREIEEVKEKANHDLDKYIKFMNSHGYYAEGFSSLGMDIIEEIMKLVPTITKKFKNSVFFGGQVVFPKDTFLTRLLHNYTVFVVQRKLYNMGIEFVILPIKLKT